MRIGRRTSGWIEDGKMNERLRNGLVNVGLVVLSVVVFFVILEGYFVLFDPQISDTAMGTEYDQLLGSKNKPNFEGSFEGTYAIGEFKVQINTNSKGLRDKEYDYIKSNGTKRIIFLGDSFTWGWGVEYDKRVTEILENRLKNTQVINMGVPGYGTTQDFLFLKTEGLKYNPDLIIILFCLDTDMDDNLHGQRPICNLTSSKLILTNVPVSQEEENNNNVTLILSFKRFMGQHSHTYAFIAKRIESNPNLLNLCKKLRIADKGTDEKTHLYIFLPFVEYCSDTYTPELNYSWNLTKALLKEIDITAKENNAKTLIVLIPSKLQIHDEFWEKIKRQYTLNDQNYKLSKPNDILVQFGSDNDISVLDMLPTFREHAKNGERLYFYKDGHWNEKGHKLAAELIYDKLIEEQLIPLGGEE